MKEPLLHFMLVGMALCGLYAWSDPEPEPDTERIVVREDQIRVLATGFEGT